MEKTREESGVRGPGAGGPPDDRGRGWWRGDDRERHRMQVMSVLGRRPGASPREIARRTKLGATPITETVEALQAEGLVREGEPPGRLALALRALRDPMTSRRGSAGDLPSRPALHLTEKGKEHPPFLRYREEMGAMARAAWEESGDLTRFRPWYLFDRRRWEINTKELPYVSFQLGRNPRRPERDGGGG